MKVRLDTVIHDLHGKALSDPNNGAGSLTIGSALVGALLGADPRQPLDGAEKFRRWQLAQRVVKVTEADLSIEEVALVKKLVGEAWTASVVGPVWTALEKGDA